MAWFIRLAILFEIWFFYVSVAAFWTHANQILEQMFLCYVVCNKIKGQNITPVMGTGTWKLRINWYSVHGFVKSLCLYSLCLMLNWNIKKHGLEYGQEYDLD